MEHLMSVFSILKSNLVSLIIYQCMFHVLSWHSNGLAETRVALNLWVTVIIIFPIWLVILQVYQYIQLAISYTMYHIKSAIYPFVTKKKLYTKTPLLVVSPAIVSHGWLWNPRGFIHKSRGYPRMSFSQNWFEGKFQETLLALLVLGRSNGKP